MTKTVVRIQSSDELPKTTEVVIIGGGIVGVSAALTLAERNIPVVLLEKGHIAGEQSSRNLGWIRKTSRHAEDVPLALAADKLWAGMEQRIGASVGYKQAGVLFTASSEAQMGRFGEWLDSVKSLSMDSRLLSAEQLDKLIPGGKGRWHGAIHTPSDGYAEPHKATPLMAQAAMNKGVVMVQNCAVRGLITSTGKISGVMTEKGEVRCQQVLLAGGAWSRRFLGNHGISLPSLHLVCSVLRTSAVETPTEIAVGGPDFSFRRHEDGGLLMMQRGAIEAPLTLDHLLIGYRYLGELWPQRKILRISFGRHFFNDLKISRRWRQDRITPMEILRTMDPPANQAIIREAMTNASNAWPVLSKATIAETWAGAIDVTPDSMPVIDHIAALPGLTVATGLSGHGFGTGPAVGHLAADLISGDTPLTDPAPYRFSRL